ncbi:LOW QUALITY PROTEIN: hypothetical protein PHMEG_00035330, partial [Phytophthora megakarya]
MAPKPRPKGRISVKGVSKKPRTFERNGVSNAKKAHLIQSYHKHGMAATVKKFYPSLTRAQQKDKKARSTSGLSKNTIFAVASGRGKLLKNRAVGQSKVLEDDEEEEIMRWVTDLRREVVPVTTFMLETKAKE